MKIFSCQKEEKATKQETLIFIFQNAIQMVALNTYRQLRQY